MKYDLRRITPWNIVYIERIILKINVYRKIKSGCTWAIETDFEPNHPSSPNIS